MIKRLKLLLPFLSLTTLIFCSGVLAAPEETVTEETATNEIATNEIATEDIKSSAVYGSQAVVYWNSYAGDDAKSGDTKENAVQSFERAKELLQKDGTIFICSSTEITGNVTWSLAGYGNAKLQRASETRGSLIRIEGGKLTLEDIVIDGAEYDYNGSERTEPMIKSDNGGTLILNSGAVLQNNRSNNMGGAIAGWKNFNITMNKGAIIKNNSTENAHYGGGIFLANNSKLIMNGGEIDGNTGNRGGGIALLCSEMTMKDGKIENNQTYNISGSTTQFGYGGGIYMADHENISGAGVGSDPITSGPASLHMSGGEITGNKGKIYGGGICTFPQSGNASPDISITIDGGNISDNTVDGSGGGIAMFFNSTKFNMSSGAISKNQASSSGGGLFLYSVTDAIMFGGTISSNEAEQAGGGVSLYPESSSEMKTMGSAKISENIAPIGGGIYIGRPNKDTGKSNIYTATGNTVIKNNNATSDQAQTKGDGVYVAGSFNIGDTIDIDPSNDVYLPSGKYIQVISPFSGANAEHQVQITSEDKEVENTEKIGTKLVLYTEEAGGDTAALAADQDRLYVPSVKMPDDLVIGNSKLETTWMTYVTDVSIQYKWVGSEYPSDVNPPQIDKIRLGNQYTAKDQGSTQENYVFDGWYTDEDCTNQFVNETPLNTNIILYGKWTKSNPDNGGGTEDGTGGHTGHTTTNEKTESNTIEPDKVPETGDTTGAGFWLMLSIISGLGLIWINKRQQRASA